MTGTHETIHPSELLHITIPAASLLFGSLAALAYWLWRRKEEGLNALAKATGMAYDADGAHGVKKSTALKAMRRRHFFEVN